MMTRIGPQERRIDVGGAAVFLHPQLTETGGLLFQTTTCKTQWPALTCTCGWYTLVWPPPPRNGGEPGGASWLEQLREEDPDGNDEL